MATMQQAAPQLIKSHDGDPVMMNSPYFKLIKVLKDRGYKLTFSTINDVDHEMSVWEGRNGSFIVVSDEAGEYYEMYMALPNGHHEADYKLL
jgi:hypothetical protein